LGRDKSCLLKTEDAARQALDEKKKDLPGIAEAKERVEGAPKTLLKARKKGRRQKSPKLEKRAKF